MENDKKRDDWKEKFKEFFMMGYYCNKCLKKPYSDPCEFFKNGKDEKVDLLLLMTGFNPKEVRNYFKTIDESFETNLKNASKQIDQIFEKDGTDITELEYEDFLKLCKSKKIM